MNHGHADHGCARLGQILVIFGQAAVAGQPREGPFDNPAFWQEEKAFGPLRPFDDLQADFPPGAESPQPSAQVAAIALVGPQQAQMGEVMPPHLQHLHSPVGVLHTRRGDDHAEEQPKGIHADMALAALDLLAGIVATAPPFSVVFTD